MQHENKPGDKNKKDISGQNVERKEGELGQGQQRSYSGGQQGGQGQQGFGGQGNIPRQGGQQGQGNLGQQNRQQQGGQMGQKDVNRPTGSTSNVEEEEE